MQLNLGVLMPGCLPVGGCPKLEVKINCKCQSSCDDNVCCFPWFRRRKKNECEHKTEKIKENILKDCCQKNNKL